MTKPQEKLGRAMLPCHDPNRLDAIDRLREVTEITYVMKLYTPAEAGVQWE
jgi:hypothetical protein